MTALSPTLLSHSEWTARAQAHAAAVDALTAGHRERRGLGERHALEDFLFDYYGIRPSRLRRWHPGAGVALEDAGERSTWRFYRDDAGVTAVDVDAFLAARGRDVRGVAVLLRATARRDPWLGCFGLHEWAMVYRAGDDRRHPLPLRLGQAGTDAVVESHRLACTHCDAFRFFTPEAAPLNQLRPTRETQAATEQPGCLHATMDLYKWCAKLAPAVPSDLTLEAFTLALDARALDMQASPYDVAPFGLDPIPVETADGKRAYVVRQREIMARGQDLRARILEVLEAIRGSAGA
nr:3-methyladenine DNA glycosylase [Demequina pelophila]